MFFKKNIKILTFSFLIFITLWCFPKDQEQEVEIKIDLIKSQIMSLSSSELEKKVEALSWLTINFDEKVGACLFKEYYILAKPKSEFFDLALTYISEKQDYKILKKDLYSDNDETRLQAFAMLSKRRDLASIASANEALNTKPWYENSITNTNENLVYVSQFKYTDDIKLLSNPTGAEAYMVPKVVWDNQIESGNDPILDDELLKKSKPQVITNQDGIKAIEMIYYVVFLIESSLVSKQIGVEIKKDNIIRVSRLLDVKKGNKNSLIIDFEKIKIQFP